MRLGPLLEGNFSNLTSFNLNFKDFFEQIIKEISSSDTSMADVIPLLAAQNHFLSKVVETDHRVKTTTQALFEAVNTRFSQASSELLLCIGSVLDIKIMTWLDHYFSERTAQEMGETAQRKKGPALPICLKCLMRSSKRLIQIPGKRQVIA